ncbi:MAG: hypothetical protein DHS20C11_06220 [Lysobacteraceae bacterium]|nr:MAG: hypothetical protein DHS20C11_06220 [Xanthomonadaceae bacterium]
MATAGTEGSFAVFIPASRGSGDPLNIQFSVENEVIGLDWCLISSVNVADEEKFTAFAKSQGSTPELKEMNGVKYLRVEGHSALNLCTNVLTEIYGVNENERMEFIIDGFEWQKDP